MCGRYTLSTSTDAIADLFCLPLVETLPPRYNIAPTQMVPVVRIGANHTRELVQLKWGLVPSWAKDPRVGSRLINARAETIAQKPSFRRAFGSQRCLIVATGFYEWTKVPGSKAKQPHFITLQTGGPFAFAGLWERWHPKGADPLETCTIITTEANGLLRPLHPRMPVILDQSAYARWLDPGVRNPEAHKALLVPYADAGMCHYPVSKLVNSPGNDSPECIAEDKPPMDRLL